MGVFNIGGKLIGMQATREVEGIDDEFYDIPVAGPVRIALTGTASNSGATLPDATKVSPFFYREILNDGANFAIIQNSNKTAWDWIGPGEEMRVTCVDRDTAAGRWRLVKTPMQLTTLKGRDYSTLDSNTIVSQSVSGTGANISQGFNGNVSFATGTTTAGRCGGTLNSASFTNSSGNQGAAILDVTFSVPNDLSTAAEEYWALLGFHSKFDGTIENGFFFHYDRALYGNNNIRRVLASAGAMTPTETAFTPSTGFRRATIITNADRNRVDWYINKTHVGSNTGLTFANILEPDFVIVKTAGTSNRQLRLDRISYWISLPGRI